MKRKQALKEELREKSLAGMAKCAKPMVEKASENKDIDSSEDDSDQRGSRLFCLKLLLLPPPF